MDIKPNINKSEQFSARYLFFVFFGTILGIELISVPSIVFKEAGHDAWISILLAYIIVTIIIGVMFCILRHYESTDIIGIQADLFGSFIAKILGTVYIIYFGAYTLTILLLYIEMIRIFIFPAMPRFIIGLLIMALVGYSLLGGMKVIVGVVFLFFILGTPFLFFLLGEPIMQVDILRFLPVFDVSLYEIAQGILSMSYTFMGFEIIFFIYPFVQQKKKAFKSSLFGFSAAALTTFFITIIAIGAFSAPQLERRIWAVMQLFKLQNFAFIERLDYFVIAELMMIMLPHVILMTWALVYSMKRIYNVPEKVSIYTYSILIIIFVSYISDFFMIEAIIDVVQTVGLWLVYIYPLILLPIVLIKKRKKGKRGSENN